MSEHKEERRTAAQIGHHALKHYFFLNDLLARRCEENPNAQNVVGPSLDPKCHRASAKEKKCEFSTHFDYSNAWWRSSWLRFQLLVLSFHCVMDLWFRFLLAILCPSLFSLVMFSDCIWLYLHFGYFFGRVSMLDICMGFGCIGDGLGTLCVSVIWIQWVC